ncbi:MAG: exodeoxyribonuclease III [Gammaproteobacteria bacterium]|nr:MAG: exodeoxyribonuclease III [Gammaproteobacteria bacterium]
MRVISINVNGIRAAANKGFFSWLARQRADVICIQETRAQEHQLVDAQFRPGRYHCYYFDAERKGYSGVAVYVRCQPDEVKKGIGVLEFDKEGRYLEVRLGRLSVVSLYMPSGSSGPERQASKDRFLAVFLPFLRGLKCKHRDYIVCGDFNIAHKAIDLKNWRSNRKNSGFLPHERTWLDEVFGKAGFIDAFRAVDPRPDQYTWWSNRGQSWAKNVGWRIDYQVVTPGLRKSIRSARIYKDKRFSDHAPLIMDYDIDL